MKTIIEKVTEGRFEMEIQVKQSDARLAIRLIGEYRKELRAAVECHSPAGDDPDAERLIAKLQAADAEAGELVARLNLALCGVRP